MLRKLRDEDRAKLLGSIGLNSLSELYSVFPPKAREFSEGVFSRLKDLLHKSPHASLFTAWLAEEEAPPPLRELWNSSYGRYLTKELDRLQYEFPDELLQSPALLDLAYDSQGFLSERLGTEVACFSFSSGFSALLESVRISLENARSKRVKELPISPLIAVAETLPHVWRTSLNLNFPGVAFVSVPLTPEGTLAWQDIGELGLSNLALAVYARETSPTQDPALLRQLAPHVLVAEVILDPLSLYPLPPLPSQADFRILELQELLCSQRQITGLSAGVLSGSRAMFESAQLWLVGKSKVTRRKYWFQPSTLSLSPLPRFLPLESLKAYLSWQVYDAQELDAVALKARAQYDFLKNELGGMGVPCLMSFSDGRQGIFKVPNCEKRLAAARSLGWREIASAQTLWGTLAHFDFTSGLTLKIGPYVSDALIQSLVGALTHD